MMNFNDDGFPEVEMINAEDEFEVLPDEYIVQVAIDNIRERFPDELKFDPATEYEDVKSYGDTLRDELIQYRDNLSLADPQVMNGLKRTFLEEHIRDEKRRADIAADTREDDKPLLYSAAALRAAGNESENAFRVEGFWPVGGRMNVFAQPKVGKSTMIGELVYSLLSGDKFMGTQDVLPLDGSVCVLDFELTDREALGVYGAVLDWTEANDADDRFHYASLRGRASLFDITDPLRRRELAQTYGGHAVYVLDCASPLMAALHMEEIDNTDVQRFLSGFDEFVRLAGGPSAESVVVHHAGKTSGLPRGATSWEGSGSANVILTASSARATATRFIEVMGGRGQMFEGKRPVNLDASTGRLSLGVAPVHTATQDFGREAVLTYIAENDGVGRDAIIKSGIQGLTRAKVEEHLDDLIADRQVTVETAERNKKAHHVADDPQGEPLL